MEEQIKAFEVRLKQIIEDGFSQLMVALQQPLQNQSFPRKFYGSDSSSATLTESQEVLLVHNSEIEGFQSDESLSFDLNSKDRKSTRDLDQQNMKEGNENEKKLVHPTIIIDNKLEHAATNHIHEEKKSETIDHQKINSFFWRWREEIDENQDGGFICNDVGIKLMEWDPGGSENQCGGFICSAVGIRLREWDPEEKWGIKTILFGGLVFLLLIIFSLWLFCNEASLTVEDVSYRERPIAKLLVIKESLPIKENDTRMEFCISHQFFLS